MHHPVLDKDLLLDVRVTAIAAPILVYQSIQLIVMQDKIKKYLAEYNNHFEGIIPVMEAVRFAGVAAPANQNGAPLLLRTIRGALSLLRTKRAHLYSCEPKWVHFHSCEPKGRTFTPANPKGCTSLLRTKTAHLLLRNVPAPSAPDCANLHRGPISGKELVRTCSDGLMALKDFRLSFQ